MNTLSYALQSFNDRAELQKAYGLAELTLEQLKLPQLMETLTIEFNNHFLNKAGTANMCRRAYYGEASEQDKKLGWGPSVKGWKYVGQIKLGTKYFAVASEADKVETVIHETCHIARDWLYYENQVLIGSEYRKTKGHDQAWIDLMIKAGYAKPDRFHCLDTSQFKTFYQWKCPCGNSYRLTAQMGGRIMNGTSDKQCMDCKRMVLRSHLKKMKGEDLVYGSANT